MCSVLCKNCNNSYDYDEKNDARIDIVEEDSCVTYINYVTCPFCGERNMVDILTVNNHNQFYI